MKILGEEMKEVWDVQVEFEGDERDLLLAFAKREMPQEELEAAMLQWCIRKSMLDMIERVDAENKAES